MLFGKYIFSINFITDAILPPYKGSTIRGSLGHGLKKTCCVLRESKCDSCILKTKCVYAFLFEKTAIISEKAYNSVSIAAFPRPYVIEPETYSNKTHYKAKDPLSFNILLFGKANEYLPYIIYSFIESGKTGIGRRIKGQRGKFWLNKVFFNEREIYSGENITLLQKEDLLYLSIDPKIDQEEESLDVIKIEFITPLRIKYLNRLSDSIPFHLLIRACLRRISSLMLFYGEGEPPLDYKGLVKLATTVEILDSSIRWHDWKRYSNKQHKGMFLGGIKGKIVYKGNLSPFLPIIQLAEILHIGKQTTFGLGKIKSIRIH